VADQPLDLQQYDRLFTQGDAHEGESHDRAPAG
jgi:hypothetical protein